ncbi:MAG: hypothetical protein WEC59_10695, partial [Salibacteraceae bacterium]
HEEMELPLVLRNQFGEASVAPLEKIELNKKLNALFDDIDKDLMRNLNIKGGVQIKELGPGKLRNAGIAPEFIITKVDQEWIKNKEQLMEVLESKSGGVLIEGIYPNGKRAYYGFGI